MVEAAFTLLFGAVALGSLALVVAPFRRPRAEPVAQDARRSELLAARDAALRTLLDLDFDHRLGNLADEDYRELRARHKPHAIALLRATPGYAAEDFGNDEVEADIERRVREARERRRPGPAGPGDRSATVQPVGRDRGGASRPDGCPGCGKPLRPGTPLCPSCRRGAPARGARQRRSDVTDRSAGVPAGTALERDAVPPRRPVPTRRREPARGPGAVSSRTARWLAGSAVVGLLVVALTAWLYLSGQASRADQRPVSQLPPAVEYQRPLAILPGQPGTALFGHGDGLLASRDGGRTWRARPVPGDALALAAHPARPSVAYAAGQGVFLKSEDDAETWTALRHDLPGTDVLALGADPDEPDGLYAYVGGHGLFWTSDGGARWRRVAAAVPARVSAVAVVGGAQPRLYLATADRGVLSSPDGRGWANANGFVNGALPTRRVSALVYDERSGDSFAGNAGVAMVGALYAGTDRGLFKSVDGGGSWTRLPLQADVAALALSHADPRALLVVDSAGRVFRSEDRGLTWRN